MGEERWNDIFHLRLGEQVTEYLGDDDWQIAERSELKRIYDSWTVYERVNRSPIEKLLCAEMLFIIDGYQRPRLIGDNAKPDPKEKWASFLIPQYRMFNHAFDFAIISVNGTHSKTVLLECDGHDFHERTKEQAARDRSFDRKVQAAGGTFLRFTGAEIVKSPRACAVEVERLVEAMMEDLIKTYGLPR